MKPCNGPDSGLFAWQQGSGLNSAPGQGTEHRGRGLFNQALPCSPHHTKDRQGRASHRKTVASMGEPGMGQSSEHAGTYTRLRTLAHSRARPCLPHSNSMMPYLVYLGVMWAAWQGRPKAPRPRSFCSLSQWNSKPDPCCRAKRRYRTITRFHGKRSERLWLFAGRCHDSEEAGQRFHRAGHQTVQFPSFRTDQPLKSCRIPNKSRMKRSSSRISSRPFRNSLAEEV